MDNQTLQNQFWRISISLWNYRYCVIWSFVTHFW